MAEPIRLQAPRVKVVSAADASVIAAAVASSPQLPAVAAPATATAAPQAAAALPAAPTPAARPRSTPARSEREGIVGRPVISRSSARLSAPAAGSTCLLPHVELEAAPASPRGASTCMLPIVRADGKAQSQSQAAAATPRGRAILKDYLKATAEPVAAAAGPRGFDAAAGPRGFDAAARLRKKPRSANRLALAVGLLVLFGGGLYLAIDGGGGGTRDAGEAALAQGNPLLQTKEGKRLQEQSRRLESRVGQTVRPPAVAPARPVDHAAMQQRFLDRLHRDGYYPDFQAPPLLAAPAPGKTLIVDCLLREPLDELTEIVWRNAGILDAETQVLDPYLRTLQIRRDDMRYLSDPHVLAVTLDLWRRNDPPPGAGAKALSTAP